MLIQDTEDNRHLFQKTEGGVVYFRMRQNGKKIVESLETSDHAQARVERARRQIEYSDKPRIKSTLPQVVTIEEIVADYVKWLYANHGNHPKSVQNQEQVLWKTVKHPVFMTKTGSRPAASITSDDLQQYRSVLKERGNTDATVNNKLAYMRAAFRHAMRKQTPPKVLAVPYFPIVQVHNVRQGCIDMQDYLNILAFMPDSLAPFFTMAFHTGWREMELLNLEWSQLNMKKQLAELRVGTTKNNLGRRNAFYGDMQDCLNKQKALRDSEYRSCPWVFFWHEKDVLENKINKLNVPKAGTHIEEADLRKLWQLTLELAGRPDVLIHDMRRSAISMMIQEYEFSESEAMEYSGHVTTDTFRRYNIKKTKTLFRSATKATEAFKRLKVEAMAQSD